MIVGGQNMLRIREGLARMFGIELEIPSIYNFKQSISLHYAHTRECRVLGYFLAARDVRS
jgi:hypothetical protein